MADKPDKKNQDSVSFVKEKSKEGEDYQTMQRVQINRAYYNGYQWISFDQVAKKLYVPQLKPGEKRYTYNKIKPAVKTLLAKTCKNRVKLEVRPDTNDVERIEIAKAGLKFLHAQWQKDKMDYKCRRLKFHMIIDGFPALMVYVDKNAGKDLPQDEVEGLEMESMPSKSGVITTVVVDQLSLKVDPSAEDITEIRWALREYPEDVDVIFEEWGQEVTEEDNIAVRNNEIGTNLEQNKRCKNMAMIYDYWELPCPKYPNGRRIVVSGDKELLKEEKDPGEFPFIFFPCDPVPGKAVGGAIVTDMTTPQRSYNIKRTAEARMLEEMGNPIWLTPTNSVPDMNDLTNEIGGVVEYTPIGGGKPERVQGNTVDQGWQNAMERDDADMEDISGAHEISQGSQPKGNNTLGGLQLQVEQDETKLALMVQSYEEGMKQWGEKVLRLVKKHFPEEQQLSIVGENGEIEAFTFSGSDLESMELNVDVIPGSSMPDLKVVKDQKIMEMWGAGMFTDPRTGQPDTRKVVRMLGESIANDYFDDTEQDENKALSENRAYKKAFEDEQTAMALTAYAQEKQAFEQIQQSVQRAAEQGIDPAAFGIPQMQEPQPPIKLPVVRDFYDHQTHIEVHNRYRKTDDYDELAPELQRLIDQHVQEHIQALQAPAMADQQQQQMMMQQQGQAQQEQMNAQSQEAEAQRQHQLSLQDQKHAQEMQKRQLEHGSRMQQEQLKGDNALLQASLRQAK